MRPRAQRKEELVGDGAVGILWAADVAAGHEARGGRGVGEDVDRRIRFSKTGGGHAALAHLPADPAVEAAALVDRVEGAASGLAVDLRRGGQVSEGEEHRGGEGVFIAGVDVVYARDLEIEFS